ncbi:MAG: T9SS type A sorting domain-containing protein [Bacteroidales bacterium]|nr:T9SS type A sorting domain-containing protein [Bacteroidales bacterium]
MKKQYFLLFILLVLAFKINAQIPNNGFENWTTTGAYETPIFWTCGNSSSSGAFYPVTKSTDHYPTSMGSYSIRLENKLPLINGSSYGFAFTENGTENAGSPSFPLLGHPTSFCGYYKCFPLNNDTMQIGIMLFNNGEFVAGAELLCTDTVANWTSFNVPISTYTDADSACIAVAAFYNDTNCALPNGPYGNSVLYVDNLSFDSLITSVSERIDKCLSFNLFPNPAYDILNLDIENSNNSELMFNIYNMLGTLVKSERLFSKQIYISDLCNGMYMLEIKSNERTYKQKLIIQK